MPWLTPKTDWTSVDGVTDVDMNRIEGNVQQLADDQAAHQSDTLKHQRTASIVVAASNSSAAGKAAAQYVCDGVSDQTEINNALAALGTTGGCVLLLEGTYIVDSPINVPSNATLAGQGLGTVIKIKDALNVDINVVRNAYQTNGNTKIVLRDFVIDGNKANNTTGVQHGVYLCKTTYSMVRGLLAINCRHYSIYLSYSSKNIVVSNTCQGNVDGIRLGSSPYNVITSNICQGNTTNGIYVYGGSDNIVTSNTCQGNTTYGIYVNGSSKNIVVSNTCQGNVDGIRLSSSPYNVITSNICQGNSQHGIHLWSSSNNTVIGNICLENSQSDSATYDNINIDYGSDYNNVQANTCRAGALTNKPRYGIRINSADCDGNLVTNNDLYTGGATGAFSNVGTDTVTTAGNRT